MIGANGPQTASEKKRWQKLLTLDTRLFVVYGAGISASFSALYELASDFGGWPQPFGIALPVVIDVYWMTALQVALDSSRSNRERWWAAAHAFLAIGLSITGNIMYHEMDTGTLRLSKTAHGDLIAILACIPVVLTGTLTHLVLLARGSQAGPEAVPVPAGAPVPAASPEPGGARSGENQAPAAPAGNQDPVLSGSREPVPALVPGTSGSGTAVPAITAENPEPVRETAAGGGPGNQDGPAAGEQQPASAARPAARPAEEKQDRADLAEDEEGESREAVIEEMAARPRPSVTSLEHHAEDQQERALDLVAEFRKRTGARMTNQELAKALHIAKASVVGENGIRRAIKDREETQEKEETAA